MSDGNRVTDRHVGTVGAGKWDPWERYKDVRHKAGLNEDVEAPYRARRSGKDLPAKPSWKDFTPGMPLVARLWDTAGYVAYFRCHVIDAYADPGRRMGYDGADGRVFVVVGDSKSERYQWLVGHVVELDFSNSAGHWLRWRTKLSHTSASLGEYARMPKDSTPKPSRG